MSVLWMLDNFRCSRNFYNVKMVVSVDCEARKAEFYVTKDRDLVGPAYTPIMDYPSVDTPEKADQWISDRLQGVHATVNAPR